MPGVLINHGGAWVSFVTSQRADTLRTKYFLKSEANKSKGYNFLISTTFVTWDLLTFAVLTFLNSAQNELPSVRLPTPAEEQTPHWPKNKRTVTTEEDKLDKLSTTPAQRVHFYMHSAGSLHPNCRAPPSQLPHLGGPSPGATGDQQAALQLTPVLKILGGSRWNEGTF